MIFPPQRSRFCACLDIGVQVCAPRHPQENAFVERYHRSYQQECLALERPATLEQARQVTFDFQQHYNFQRPNQALACGNQPPRTAFPQLASLPPLPLVVDPDSWLDSLDGWHVERKVNAHGSVTVDLKSYYISSKLVGHRLTEASWMPRLAACRSFNSSSTSSPCPKSGLVGHLLTFDQFLTHMLQQARAQARLHSLQERRLRTATFASP